MRPEDQEKIQAVAFDKGDDRRLAKKPIFTSSQQTRLKIVKSEIPPSENKSYFLRELPNRRKMKSDTLGASGHTTNTTRSSLGKGKDDDLKGKKNVSKGPKDSKPAEKSATSKAKTIVKAKPENNDHTKTESSASKGDSTNTPKPISSGKMGARPKTTNGTSNSPTKTKLLKKTVKDPSSPVKGTAPCVKSANCNGEHSNSSSSPGELTQDHVPDEQPNSASSSPHVNKTGKNGLDCSRDQGVGMKLKSTVKISNGVSTKRKVNEAMCQEPNSSSTKKTPTDAGNEPVLQKKKINKTSNCAAQQRPKSAPAALSKKPGIPGDCSNAAKSVSSKQNDVKSDIKPVNQSAPVDKQGLLNKKTTKTSAPTSKMQTTVPNNKHGLSGSKSITNHKESRAKVQNNSKPSNFNHRLNQKSSPTAVKNGHGQQKCVLKADGSEGPVSLLKEGKQEASDAEHHTSENLALVARECLQENSMGNQDSMSQKPNLEHCICQENTPKTSALFYSSNSKEDLTEAANQTKAINVDKTGSGKVQLISVSEEQKPNCKNICDSENWKCADSSSESELCSVKEVERVPKQKEDATFLEFTNNVNNVVEPCHQGVASSHQPSLSNGGHFMNCMSERQISEFQRDLNAIDVTDCHENSDIRYMSQWNKHSGISLERESPESESGSASTSSDDIKPRSEDYDAGGSQDDDGSNERGISKCSTMRCHDFLGRSSSDTSTPEELKGYDGSLRIDVKMRKESSELFRVNSTSDDEGPRKRTEPWLQRDGPRHSANHTAVCCSVQFPQEVEHLSSSADETEDERSETENAGLKAPSDASSQPFQGIVNLAFDDIIEIESEEHQAPGNKSFMRSVLLSVDECEELGSDEGDPNTSQIQKDGSLTPCDVFEKNDTNNSSEKCSANSPNRTQMEDKSGCITLAPSPPAEHDNSVVGQDVAESMFMGHHKPTESEFKSQARPCHLDLYTESPSDARRFCCTKTANACKSQFLDYQGRENHASSSESSNTALSAAHTRIFLEGHIDDDIDSLAQSCMFDHRPSKSLSPIYEMDPGEGIEQRLKSEARIVDFEIEDQQFVERDWTLLRELLADHGSDVDVINSVPEDLSLAQYLINQTLLLAKENSKSQGKAWGDLSSPYEDSTSVTVTSFSPDECSSPHGEWTILELETHH